LSACERYESMFESLIAGQLDEESLSPLLAHCTSCENCRRLLGLHRDISDTAARVPEPGEEDLDRVQERVLRTIRGARRRRPARIALVAASVILPFVGGLLLGRGGGSASSRLVATLGAEAASNRALADVEDSRFTYSNVSFRRLEGERIALAFDVTTHLELVEPLRSELVREVLAQSLLNPSSIGARLKAMSLAAGEIDPKLEDAILFALRHDDSLAVRLEALAVLSARLDDHEVQAAVMGALRDDPAVQVRLLALESLAEHRVDHERIRNAIRERERPGAEALMVRLAEYEKNPMEEPR
jgi:hypothetical protein